MSQRNSLHVIVTAEDIAAGAKPDDRDDPNSHRLYNPFWAVPVEEALARLSGQEVHIDDGSSHEPPTATIWHGTWCIVVDLPPDAAAWLDRSWVWEPVDPFEFDIEIPEWVKSLVVRA